jgi:hypothetical protein
VGCASAKPCAPAGHLISKEFEPIIGITCDMCNKVRPNQDKTIASDSWILGYDLELENANALQRSLRFSNR